jgi:Protein of unknown function (DUF559)
MPRLQHIPEQLKRGPVTVAYAERLGFSRWRLRGPNWKRVAWGTYLWAGLEPDFHGELLALRSRLPRGAVFSGRTAARLQGVDVDRDSAVDVTVPPGVSVRARPGIVVHTAVLDPSTVTACGPLPVTAPLRTCLDLARSLPLVEAVAALDSALHRRLVTPHELREHVVRSTRLRGVPQARRAIELTEPNVESPMESRLRMILVLGGLPRPQVQVELRDGSGNLLGRPDLLYPAARLAIEYDGTTHRSTLVADNRRQNRLQKAGYSMLRYSGPDVYQRPQVILQEVRAQLTAGDAAAPATAVGTHGLVDVNRVLVRALPGTRAPPPRRPARAATCSRGTAGRPPLRPGTGTPSPSG